MRPSVLTFALIGSLASHAALVAAAVLYGNAVSSYRSGGGPMEVQVWDVGAPGPVASPESRPVAKPDAHQHKKAPRIKRDELLVSESPVTVPEPDAVASDAQAPSGGGGRGTAVASFGEEEVDVPAKLTTRPRLRYPKDAYRDGIEGQVVVFLVIDDLGRVAEATVTTSAGNGFDEAAVEAAADLKFTPAQKGGRAVPVHIHWTCRFRIED